MSGFNFSPLGVQRVSLGKFTFFPTSFVLGVIFDDFEHFWESFREPLETLGCHFGIFLGILGSWGVHCVGLGVPLGAFGAQSPSKTDGLFHGPPSLDDF